ncbi:CPBP family intramembrane glutamic endopeptidase [Calothrix sp. NIES-3974]|uniref:CPBP family intramembrane glutamic endopeptidase n=1 Tax=Calothrix sp. NIES-3974 TaxID=2005462 RepID=UPI000B5F3D1C|nr:type II CAAX endopeptidase family protein [Calothrix sp. NIES-3974]BAZ04310.1 caax amino protease family protein [Calothrix sp. NIES-3974]
MSSLSTIIGLCFALAGPALLARFGSQFFRNPESLASKILQQIALAMLFVIILGIIVFGEEQPLSSIGLHSLRWQSILWGLIFASFLVFIYSPLLMWSMTKLSFVGFEKGLAKLTPLPVWYLILAVVIGGIVEEGLYRGYAAERLSLLTGSYWIGCALSLIAFGLAHVPLWGWIPAFTTVLSGCLLTLFYLGTGDLLTAIVAHIATDCAGIIIPKVTSTK